jgi:hypothetical protein
VFDESVLVLQNYSSSGAESTNDTSVWLTLSPFSGMFRALATFLMLDAARGRRAAPARPSSHSRSRYLPRSSQLEEHSGDKI